MATVVILGGCGDAGWRLAKLLLMKTKEIISEIIIVDISDRKLQKLAHELTDSRVKMKCFDARNVVTLNETLLRCQMVVNLIGPYFEHSQFALDAAIKCGCNYIDACDDGEPMLKSFERDQDARSYGVTALVGMATTPGISNLLFKLASAELDSGSHDVVVSWGYGYDRESRSRPQHKKTHFNVLLKMAGILSKVGFARATGRKPTAFAQHICHITTTPIVQNAEGDTVNSLLKVPNLFFPGLPELWNGFTTGHPEQMMLKRSSNVNKCINTTLMSDFEWRGACNLKADTNAGKLDKMSTSLFFEIDSTPPDTESWLPCSAGGVVAIVRGTKDGVPAVAGATLRISRHNLLQMTDGDDIAELGLLKNPKDGGLNFKDCAMSTAAPLAVAILDFLEKTEKPTGVMTPEQYFDSEEFFKKYAILNGVEDPKLEDVVQVGIEMGTERVSGFTVEPL